MEAEFFRELIGGWRWRIVTLDGRVIACCSQLFSTRQACAANLSAAAAVSGLRIQESASERHSSIAQ